MNVTEAKTKSTPTTNYDDGCTPSYDASNALYDGVFVTTCTSTFAYDTPAQPSCNADQAIVITPLLLTAISGTGSLACDNNGNMTTDDQGHTLVFDAWNRLVEVKDASGFLLHAYTYDGLGRRITVSDGYTVTDDYYTTSAQLIQENVGTNVTATYLWSTFYVDGLLCRSSSSSGSYLATFDANYNVTSMYSTGGTTQERFLYSPFGARTVLNASWSGTSETKNWTVGFEGLFLDTAVGMYYARNRWYSPSLMRWISWDPTGYSDGLDPNVAYADNPINERDPQGTEGEKDESETLKEVTKAAIEKGFEQLEHEPGLAGQIAKNYPDIREGGENAKKALDFIKNARTYLTTDDSKEKEEAFTNLVNMGGEETLKNVIETAAKLGGVGGAGASIYAGVIIDSWKFGSALGVEVARTAADAKAANAIRDAMIDDIKRGDMVYEKSCGTGMWVYLDAKGQYSVRVPKVYGSFESLWRLITRKDDDYEWKQIKDLGN